MPIPNYRFCLLTLNANLKLLATDYWLPNADSNSWLLAPDS